MSLNFDTTHPVGGYLARIQDAEALPVADQLPLLRQVVKELDSDLHRLDAIILAEGFTKP